MHSTGFTVLFAAAVCGVCSIVVSTSAVALRDRQEENKVIDRQTKVLNVAGLAAETEKLSADEVRERFEKSIVPLVVDHETGEILPDDPKSIDLAKAAGDPALSDTPPENAAKVRSVPKKLLAYHVKEDGKIKLIVLPVEGKGLWSTLYGYLALESDANTVAGLTFYQHGETPGLGGEVDNPRWKALWPGRKIFGPDGEPEIEVKGHPGPPEKDPYRVDVLSGATLTSRGVTNLIRFWVDDNGFGPFLKKERARLKGNN